MVPAWDKTLLTEKKPFRHYSGFEKDLSDYCMVFMKNCLTSIFNWIVEWKQGLLRPNVSYECISQRCEVAVPGAVLCRQKSYKGKL